MYRPIIKWIWASKAGREPNKIKVTGKNIHCIKTVDFLKYLTYHFISRGTGGKSIVLKIADTNIPTIETVIIWLVKIGRLKDKTVKLNFWPPKSIGSHPNKNNKRAAVAQDQNPSKIVYRCPILCQIDIFLLFRNPNII